MKKSIKIFVSGVFIIATVGTFMGCNSSDKSLAKGKELINENQYEKAVASLELALDYNPKNKEAKELRDMVEDYLEADKAFKDGNIGKAEVKIEAIGDKDNNYHNFKKSVDILEKSIDEKAKYEKEIDNDIKKLSDLIDNGNYADALLLSKSLDGRDMSKQQREKFDNIKMKLNSKISIESSNKK
ncbi:hypothetical protein FHH43_08385 [Clostridium perfringens]|nr:hypothetical protein [Clostridium perfringens]